MSWRHGAPRAVFSFFAILHTQHDTTRFHGVSDVTSLFTFRCPAYRHACVLNILHPPAPPETFGAIFPAKLVPLIIPSVLPYMIQYMIPHVPRLSTICCSFAWRSNAIVTSCPLLVDWVLAATTDKGLIAIFISSRMPSPALP